MTNIRSSAPVNLLLVSAVALFAALPAAGQSHDAAPKPPSATARSVGKTADGQPDIQGMWLFFDNTPFETPGGPPRRRAGETAETAGSSEALEAAATRAAAPAAGAGGGGEGNVAGFGDRRTVVPRRLSIVVDPPDGKVPVIAAAVEHNHELTAHYFDSYWYHTEGERCIARGVPSGMIPAGYNNAVQILQTPGYVAIVAEMIHETRLIPVDGSPHLPQQIRLWAGDSRGRWDGNTLVIDTTNFNDKGTPFQSRGSGYLSGIRQSEGMHVVERLTPVSATTINYEVTVDDPKVYTRPWKAALPLVRDDSYRMYEFGCHEGNFLYITNTLRAGRVQDKSLAEPPTDATRLAAAEEAAKKDN